MLLLAPMAMIQAVSISADPLTNGMSFLFVAWSLYLIEGKKTIDNKDLLGHDVVCVLSFSR